MGLGASLALPVLRTVYDSEGRAPRVPVPSYPCFIRANKLLIAIRLRNEVSGACRHRQFLHFFRQIAYRGLGGAHGLW